MRVQATVRGNQGRALAAANADSQRTVDPPPLMTGGSQGVSGYLTSGMTQQVATVAQRNDVVGFDVILQSPYSPDGRALGLEIGDHGISLRDPLGALIKVLPIEHLTGWSIHEDTQPPVLIVVTSADLVTFDKLHFQIAESRGTAALNELEMVASRRARALIHEQDEALQRGVSTSRKSSLTNRKGSTYRTKIHEGNQAFNGSSSGGSSDEMGEVPPQRLRTRGSSVLSIFGRRSARGPPPSLTTTHYPSSASSE